MNAPANAPSATAPAPVPSVAAPVDVPSVAAPANVLSVAAPADVSSVAASASVSSVAAPANAPSVAAPAPVSSLPASAYAPSATASASVSSVAAPVNAPSVTASADVPSVTASAVPRALRRHLGSLAGAVLLGVLVWRLGGGPFLDGLRRIDVAALLAALGIGAVTTVCSAWRWALVARGLRLTLPLGPAVADYYRALFLNAALPGGVLGDVHRAVRHGRGAGDLARCVKAVVLERAAGQAALAVVGAVVLVTVDSPVRSEARHAVPLVALGAVGACAVLAALRMNRGRTAATPRARSGDTRAALLSRRAWPGIAVSSAVVLAGHLALFVLAARVAGSGASATVLAPLAVLALLAMSLPLNVGGWGPREGVTAWSFAAAGLGADSGLAVAVVYGVLGFAASLPGAAVLAARVVRGRVRLRSRPAADPRHDPAGHCPRPPPASPASAVSSEKYAPKESVRLASSALPFSAEPSEGRPMTPESV